MQVEAPISVGELFDKLTILEIKLEKISDPDSLVKIHREKELLEKIIQEKNLQAPLGILTELKDVNLNLWEIEDKIRLLEAEKNFGNEFIETARSVYMNNDKRFLLKDALNQHFGSLIQETKSYPKY